MRECQKTYRNDGQREGRPSKPPVPCAQPTARRCATHDTLHSFLIAAELSPQPPRAVVAEFVRQALSLQPQNCGLPRSSASARWRRYLRARRRSSDGPAQVPTKRCFRLASAAPPVARIPLPCGSWPSLWQNGRPLPAVRFFVSVAALAACCYRSSLALPRPAPAGNPLTPVVAAGLLARRVPANQPGGTLVCSVRPETEQPARGWRTAGPEAGQCPRFLLAVRENSDCPSGRPPCTIQESDTFPSHVLYYHPELVSLINYFHKRQYHA